MNLKFVGRQESQCLKSWNKAEGRWCEWRPEQEQGWLAMGVKSVVWDWRNDSLGK